MATYANWTVVFDDKLIINQSVKNEDGHPIGYKIEDDAFWNDSKWSNIWAIQYKDDDLDYNDTIEHRDQTPHTTWNKANLGDFRTQFVDKWDAAHIALLQSNWDEDSREGESEADKIARLGPRPTSYSSS